MEILGQTIDDAAGEAIDKCSKVMGLADIRADRSLTNWHVKAIRKRILSANRIFRGWTTVSAD